MECFLDNCDNNNATFEELGVGGCIQFHASIIQRQVQKMIDHSLAMEKKLGREIERVGKLKQKLVIEKERNQSLKAELDAATKNKKSLRKTESMFDDSLKNRIFKKRSDPGKVVGKENSPKKTVKQSESVETLSLSRLKTLPKQLKQQKILFVSKSSKKDDELDGNDSTYCETLETAKNTKPSWSGPAARSKLFAFEKIKQPDLAQLTELTEEMPEAPHIKQEKLTQDDNYICSDLDIFESDCEVMDADETDLPISIRDSNDSGSSLAELLKADVVVKIQEDVPLPLVRERRRTKFYGECRECQEFYDSYAERNGPSQADSFVRDCPNRCKGFLVRSKRAEPVPCRPPVIQTKFNETPVGFWNINPFTKELSDDSDETADL